MKLDPIIKTGIETPNFGGITVMETSLLVSACFSQKKTFKKLQNTSFVLSCLVSRTLTISVLIIILISRVSDSNP